MGPGLSEGVGLKHGCMAMHGKGEGARGSVVSYDLNAPKFLPSINSHEGILYLFIAARFLLACVFRQLAKQSI